MIGYLKLISHVLEASGAVVGWWVLLKNKSMNLGGERDSNSKKGLVIW